LSNIIDSGTKYKERIATQYPVIDKTDIPDRYTGYLIDYRNDEIEKYEVIFWHRLLKSIYQEPTLIECELRNNNEHETNIQTAYFRKIPGEDALEYKGDASFAAEISAGNIKLHQKVNWKYLIKLPSGKIVELGTIDMTTIFRIAQVVLPGSNINNTTDEDKKFIDELLKEANRVIRGNLFQPLKDFKEKGSPRIYLLFNVYLSNYLSAKTMLDLADSKEADLREEGLRYDARTSDILDNEKRKYMEQHMLTSGMFYCSSIIFFIMALEGFLNLVLHSFLKKRFLDNNANIEERFDLEQKIRFIPYICKGFDENSDLSSTIFSKLKKMKDYRNRLFHSKVEDSLKSLIFNEDGFGYNYDMESSKERFLSSYKFNLDRIDVMKVKDMVDDIVNDILKSMNQSTREKTEKHILNEPNIIFAVNETGDVDIGGIKEN
jgi:hypothetical protein